MSPTAQKPGNTSSLLKKIAREPLLHFVLIGVLLYGSWHHVTSRRYVIDVQADTIQQIISTYQKQYGSAPTTEQLSALVDAHIREEIYLREGQALGLDRNDEIVRRRIAQKYEFLQSDRSAPRQPAEAELQAWFAAHQDDYRIAAKRRFEHRYFAVDMRDDAQAAAGAALPRLHKSEPVTGDVFPGPQQTQALTYAEVARLFGNGPFADAVFTAPLQQWIGPIRSGFGWHDIRIQEHIPAQKPTFAAIRDQVRNDVLTAEREANNQRLEAELRARYRIRRADIPQ